MTCRQALAHALLPLLLLVGCNPEPSGVASTPAAKPGLTSVTIGTAAGERRYTVEVARTPQEQAQGLMFRASLPKAGGMLFPFPEPRIASFWMKNTQIPLDIIFIRADGRIANIAQQTVPYSLDPVLSIEPVVAVLEIAGGGAAEAGLAAGDRVSWSGGPAAS